MATATTAMLVSPFTAVIAAMFSVPVPLPLEPEYGDREQR